MDIRVLQYFITAVESHSISAAAKELFVTQPTLSRQFQDLEDELGQKLLERTNRGIVLTEKGRLFYERASEVLDMVERMKKEVRDNEALEGVVAIGAAEVPVMRKIADIISDFIKVHPKVRFDISSDIQDTVLEGLESGKLELGVIIRSADTENFGAVRLGATPRWGFLTRADSVWAQKPFITPDMLRGEPLIVSKANLRRKTLDGWLGTPLTGMKIAATITLINNARLMAAAGVGHVLTFEGIGSVLDEGDRTNIERENEDRLVFVPLSPTFTTDVEFVWKKDRPLSRPARKLLEAVQASISEA